MKKLILFSLVLLLTMALTPLNRGFATEDLTDEPTVEKAVTINAEVGLSTMGIDPLSGEKISNRITIRPLITLTYGDAYIGAQLTTADLDKRLTKNSQNYFDIYAGVEKEITDGITVDAGIGFSDMQHTTGDLWYLYFTTTVKAAVSPYLTLEIDVPTDKETLEGGILYRFGGKYSWNDVLFDLSIGGHDGAYGYDPELVSHSRLTVSKEFILWGQTVIPALHVQKAFDDDGIAADAVWLELRFAF